MKLKDIAAISGMPGLYRIVKPTRNGVIIEALAKKKIKKAVTANHQVSVLKEISVYTHTEEESVSLARVLQKIDQEYNRQLGIDLQPQSLEDFMEKILPEYDRKRVYNSDIKKLVNWYRILCEFASGTLDQLDEEIKEEKEEGEEDKEEINNTDSN